MRHALIAFGAAFLVGAAVAQAQSVPLSTYYRRNQGAPPIGTGSQSFSGTKTFNDGIVVAIQDGGNDITSTGTIASAGNFVFTTSNTYTIGTGYNGGAPAHVYTHSLTFDTGRNSSGQQIIGTLAGAGAGLQVRGDDSNAATAIGVTLDNRSAITADGGQAAAVMVAGSKVAGFWWQGAVQLNRTTPAASQNQPTCTEPFRGTLWFISSNNGAADKLQICAKAAADTYGWVDVATPIP